MQRTRIIDLTRVLAGPWATQHLADQGADVIKIEAPGGDETRHFGPQVKDQSTYFLSCNRNKRSVVLNLKNEAAREVLYRLLDTADVLVENFRPGVGQRLGLDWDTLKVQFPRLIYVAIHGFGDGGDHGYRERPGYDLVLQAMGGAASFTGHPGNGPLRSGVPIGDLVSGLYAVQAVLLGLLNRERTGQGEKMVVNMMQAQAALLTYHGSRFAVTGEEEEQRGNAHKGLVPYDIYQCKNGKLAIACGNDDIFSRLRHALSLPDSKDWNTNLGRVSCREAVDGAIEDALLVLDVAQAEDILVKAGVPVGPVLSVGETLTHPTVTLVEMAHPVFGSVQLPGPVLSCHSTRTEHRIAPDLGEHQVEVLSELGYSVVEIDTLREAGAFTWEGGQ